MTPMAVFFWIGIVLTGYAYAGYGICVWLLARIRPRPAQSADVTPSVSLIIPCYQESAWIARKLDNSLALDYPADRLEIMVVASGSDDGTIDIVRSYESRGVRCIAEAVRAGKEEAMQRAAR